MGASLPAYIVDLSEDPVVVGYVDGMQTRVCKELSGLFPWQVAVRQAGENIEVYAGPMCNTLNTEVSREEAFIFDQLDHNLPRIADAEVQQGIVAGFWQALQWQLITTTTLADSGDHAAPDLNLATKDPKYDLYLIVPSTYPSELLDIIRLALSRSDNPCQMRHCFSELLCTLIYHIEGFILPLHERRDPAQVTILDGRSERDVRLLQMVCAHNSNGWDVRLMHHVRGALQSVDFNYIQEMVKQPSTEAPLLIVHAPDETLRHRLRHTLKANGLKPGIVHWVVDGAAPSCEVKMRGAMRLLQYCRGESGTTPVLNIEHHYSFGVDIGKEDFQEVIRPEFVVTAQSFPLVRSSLFEVQGPILHSLRFNLCCGYSRRVAHALRLGYLTLPFRHCKGLTRFEVIVAITLESRVAGTAALSLAPSHAHKPTIVDCTAFRVPLMMA